MEIQFNLIHTINVASVSTTNEHLVCKSIFYYLGTFENKRFQISLDSSKINACRLMNPCKMENGGEIQTVTNYCANRNFNVNSFNSRTQR